MRITVYFFFKEFRIFLGQYWRNVLRELFVTRCTLEVNRDQHQQSISAPISLLIFQARIYDEEKYCVVGNKLLALIHKCPLSYYYRYGDSNCFSKKGNTARTVFMSCTVYDDSFYGFHHQSQSQNHSDDGHAQRSFNRLSGRRHRDVPKRAIQLNIHQTFRININIYKAVFKDNKQPFNIIQYGLNNNKLRETSNK